MTMASGCLHGVCEIKCKLLTHSSGQNEFIEEPGGTLQLVNGSALTIYVPVRGYLDLSNPVERIQLHHVYLIQIIVLWS